MPRTTFQIKTFEKSNHKKQSHSTKLYRYITCTPPGWASSSPTWNGTKKLQDCGSKDDSWNKNSSQFIHNKGPRPSWSLACWPSWCRLGWIPPGRSQINDAGLVYIFVFLSPNHKSASFIGETLPHKGSYNKSRKRCEHDCNMSIIRTIPAMFTGEKQQQQPRVVWTDVGQDAVCVGVMHTWHTTFLYEALHDTIITIASEQSTHHLDR